MVQSMREGLTEGMRRRVSLKREGHGAGTYIGSRVDGSEVGSQESFEHVFVRLISGNRPIEYPLQHVVLGKSETKSVDYCAWKCLPVSLTTFLRIPPWNASVL